MTTDILYIETADFDNEQNVLLQRGREWTRVLNLRSKEQLQAMFQDNKNDKITNLAFPGHVLETDPDNEFVFIRDVVTNKRRNICIYRGCDERPCTGETWGCLTHKNWISNFPADRKQIRKRVRFEKRSTIRKGNSKSSEESTSEGHGKDFKRKRTRHNSGSSSANSDASHVSGRTRSKIRTEFGKYSGRLEPTDSNTGQNSSPRAESITNVQRESSSSPRAESMVIFQRESSSSPEIISGL